MGPYNIAYVSQTNATYHIQVCETTLVRGLNLAPQVLHTTEGLGPEDILHVVFMSDKWIWQILQSRLHPFKRNVLITEYR